MAGPSRAGRPITREELLFRPLPARTAAGLAAVAAAGVLAAVATAQTTPGTTTQTTTTTTTPSGPTISISNCHAKRSRNAGGFTWFYCGVTADSPLGTSMSVRYTVNLTVFRPRTNGTWHPRSGKLRFSGGDELLNLAFAVRNRTIAQVRRVARVTLSEAQGATIVDGSARVVAG